jgi:hypothetical protein
MIVRVQGAPGFGTFYGLMVPGLEHDAQDGRGALVVVVCDDDGGAHVVPKRCTQHFMSPRTSEHRYQMRGNATIPSDHVYAWSRLIGTTQYEFSRVTWADGSVTVRAWKVGTSVPVHMWESSPE